MRNIKTIFSEISPLWGICRFDDIKNGLFPCRALERVPQAARSVVVFAFPYLLPEEKYEGLNVSRYAVSSDYHEIAGKRLESGAEKLSSLFPGEKFVPFIDNSPVPEVKAAVLSGIGVTGRNSLLITEKYGSFVFLGEIITTADLEPTPGIKSVCDGCGLCAEACPTGAIKDGYIDKELCLSRISQRKGELTESEKALIKETGCAWGCDICQNVCPMNKKAQVTPIKEFISSAQAKVTQNTPIEGRAFAWRGEKVIRRNLEILKETSGEK